MRRRTVAKPMIKTEWLNWLEKAWDEAQQAAWSEKNVRVSDKWVGLTDEEVMGLTCECVDDGTFNMDCAYDFARAIEAKLKEKNGG